MNLPHLSWIAEMDKVTDQDHEGRLLLLPVRNPPRIDDDRLMGTFLSKLTIILTTMKTSS